MVQNCLNRTTASSPRAGSSSSETAGVVEALAAHDEADCALDGRGILPGRPPALALPLAWALRNLWRGRPVFGAPVFPLLHRPCPSPPSPVSSPHRAPAASGQFVRYWCSWYSSSPPSSSSSLCPEVWVAGQRHKSRRVGAGIGSQGGPAVGVCLGA